MKKNKKVAVEIYNNLISVFFMISKGFKNLKERKEDECAEALHKTIELFHSFYVEGERELNLKPSLKIEDHLLELNLKPFLKIEEERKEDLKIKMENEETENEKRIIDVVGDLLKIRERKGDEFYRKLVYLAGKPDIMAVILDSEEIE